MDFNARIDRAHVAVGGGETHYVSLSFRAPTLESATERTPVNLALVLDRSGSMAGQKIALAHEAIDTSLRMLHDADRFALVVFDDEIDLLTASTHAVPRAVLEARNAVRLLGSRGSTDLEGGWARGAGEVKPHVGKGRLSRVLLATDGLANHGVRDHAEILRRVAALRDRGVSTTTFGIGRDFDEKLLQGMADQGGGHSYYIETPHQILDLLTSELGETLKITMRKVVVEVSVPGGMAVTLLNPFTVAARPGGFGVRLDDLTSGQLVELLFEVRMPAAALGTSMALGFALRHGEVRAVAATTEARWLFTTAEEARLAPRDPEVEFRAAGQVAAKAREEALSLNREGRFDDAVRQTRLAAEALRPLSVDNPAARSVLEQLEGEASGLGAPLGALDMKARLYDSFQMRRGRSPIGKAQKGE